MKKFSCNEGEIAYVSRGEGPRTFLLIHNSGGNHEMMHHSTDYFSRGAKVIAPDLLGHGISDKPHIEYSLDLLAKLLIQLCKSEGVKKIVFVGLNWGADIGIEMAKMAPELLSHLVLIEPPIFMEAWIKKEVEKQIQDLANPREEWAQETVDAVILKAPASEKEIALMALQTMPARVKASTFKHLLTWDQNHTFKCAVPTLLIQTSHPFCTEEAARTVFSQLQVGRVVGSGPWVNLEVPAQLHAMIDRFLEIS